jgi:biopolymer transport protein ExbD
MKIKKIETINVIPFIDIMLVLLAIVLTTATFMIKGSIKIDLPTATAQSQKFDKPIELTLTKNGLIFINDKETSKELLFGELKNHPKESTIIINGDENMEYKHFVSTIDMLTQNGFTQLSIATKK